MSKKQSTRPDENDLVALAKWELSIFERVSQEVSKRLLERIEELESKLEGKPAYHCPKCNEWFSEDVAEMGSRIEALKSLLDGKCPECGESLPSSCYGQSVNCLGCGFMYEDCKT